MSDTSSLKSQKERGKWGSPLEFIMSCMSYAVGLGNVWRFPYLVYRNGGGAFLVPYIVMLVCMGMPLFFLEMVIGQYSQLSPTKAFHRMAPIFQGLGYVTIGFVYYFNSFYHLVIAWTMFYLFASFSSTLGWSRCDYDFNSQFCYSEMENDRCLQTSTPTEPLTFYNKSCVSVARICALNGLAFNDAYSCKNVTQDIPLRNIVKRVLSSEEYYNDFALGIRGATWENWGAIRWEMLACLLLAWAILYLCVIKGVASTGKVVYFTALFPYVVLIALLIRGATLEGAREGIIFYVTPQWDRLASASVWNDAASQTFYALGVACASVITLASYNEFGNNCHRDAWFVSVANLLTAVFAGFAIFSIMGFMAHELGVPVSEVVKDGPGLAFIAYPEAVLRMPLPQLWAVVFFFMLFILGLGSQFAGVESLSTAIIDHWPHLRSKKSTVTGWVCVACCIPGIPMCWSGGVYFFTLLEWHVMTWAIMLCGLLEIAFVAWVYGCSRFIDNVAEMGMKFCTFTRCYWWLVWCIIAPITLAGTFVFTLYHYVPSYYGDYVFPLWVDALGILFGATSLVPLIVMGIRRYVIEKHLGWDLLRPMKIWGPAGTLVTSSIASTMENQEKGTANQYEEHTNQSFEDDLQQKNENKYLENQDDRLPVVY